MGGKARAFLDAGEPACAGLACIQASLQEESDPHKLEQLKHDLDQAQIYHWNEVEAFCAVFYRPPNQQTAQDHAQMQRHLQPAVDRFNGLADEERRSEFRDKLAGFVRVYAFLSQIMPFCDPALEMLYSYHSSTSLPRPVASTLPSPGSERPRTRRGRRCRSGKAL